LVNSWEGIDTASGFKSYSLVFLKSQIWISRDISGADSRLEFLE
jgi:hypothetical protein